jgi:hypothetical protein
LTPRFAIDTCGSSGNTVSLAEGGPSTATQLETKIPKPRRNIVSLRHVEHRIQREQVRSTASLNYITTQPKDGMNAGDETTGRSNSEEET